MDYSRQLEVFRPEEFNTPVNIVGAGAVGSWVALFLAKLGIKDITVWDFDIVAEHNLPNQLFHIRDIDSPKVEALHYIVKDATGIEIEIKNTRVTGNEQLSGIVFMLTDTMSSRFEIWREAIRMKPSVKLLIETRMDLEGGRIYNVNPLDLTHIKNYEETLYSDEEASVSACGASQSVIATAVNIASKAVWQLIKYHNHDSLDNEILLSTRHANIITTKW